MRNVDPEHGERIQGEGHELLLAAHIGQHVTLPVHGVIREDGETGEIVYTLGQRPVPATRQHGAISGRCHRQQSDLRLPNMNECEQP